MNHGPPPQFPYPQGPPPNANFPPPQHFPPPQQHHMGGPPPHFNQGFHHNGPPHFNEFGPPHMPPPYFNDGFHQPGPMDFHQDGWHGHMPPPPGHFFNGPDQFFQPPPPPPPGMGRHPNGHMGPPGMHGQHFSPHQNNFPPPQGRIHPPTANIFMQNGSSLIQTQINENNGPPATITLKPDFGQDQGRRRKRSRSARRSRSYDSRERSRDRGRRRRSRGRSSSRGRRGRRRRGRSRTPLRRPPLRRGGPFDRAFLKNEKAPSRQDFPLSIVNEGSKYSEWQVVLSNEEKRSYSAHRKSPFSIAELDKYYNLAKNKIPWNRPLVDGKPLPRSAAFLVAGNCTCQYRYSGTRWDGHKFPEWFTELTKRVMDELGLDIEYLPNSCNVNLYEDGSESVGWHSDNEPLFESQFKDCLIVSLSLGVARNFQFQEQWADGRRLQTVNLSAGDIMTMEGLFQRYYSHRVPRDNSRGPRINFTWRYVRRHDRGCPCQRDVPKCCGPTRNSPNFFHHFDKLKMERLRKEREERNRGRSR